MVKNIFKRGFTLIELLVVIAIIGILAAVVLASLNSARDKGEDAAAKSALNNARAQAELFYDDNSRAYVDAGSVQVCDTPGSSNGIQGLVANATSSTGLGGNCFASSTAWGAEVQLNSGLWYCVDSTGNSVEVAASTIGANDAICD